MRQKVIDDAVIPASCCFITARDPAKESLERYQGPAEFYFRPLGFVTNDPEITGAGRVSTPFVRTVELTIRMRMDSDQSSQDLYFLTRADALFPLEEAAVNSLQMLSPVDAAGNAYTIAPIRIMSGQQPDKLYDDFAVGFSKLFWEAIYYPPVIPTKTYL
jgi:hypothetical protein